MFAAESVAPPRLFKALRRSWLLLVLGFLLARVQAGAAPPEILRIRVPTAQVPGWFPAGTPLRMMAPDPFETLVDMAGRQAGTGAGGPRLIRAHHHARWTAGVLTGGSEVVAVLPASGPTALTLDPWTPMILPRQRDHQVVGSLESGKSVIWIEPAASPGATCTLTFDWELRARPDSDGRVFSLGLPGDETSDLALELPEGWVPLGPGGQRRGPLPSSQAGFQTWWFHGRVGASNLQLKRAGEALTPRDGTAVWVSGPTRIVLDGGGKPDHRAVNWKTDWLVQSDQRGMARFTAVLDPDLELIDVSGPEVMEFRAERDGPATRVKVALSGDSRLPTTVHFEAHSRVPIDGRWSVPAIHPVDAIWTGGNTTIVLDALHVIRDCRDRAGRRVPSPGNGAGGSDALVFEASSPDCVAELVFRQPRVDESCLVRGRLLVGPAAPVLECELIGLGGRGPASELDIDLPPSWMPDRVQWSGQTQSLSWNSALQADAGTRLHVILPGREGTPDDRSLVVRATSTAAPGRGSLVLPRVRPERMAIRDEVWVAMADKTMNLIPTSARGLAWIDPTRVKGLSPLPSPPGLDLQPALAWRWNSENAEARVDRELAESEPRTEIRCRARVAHDGQRLVVEGQILLDCGGKPLVTLPLWISQPGTDLSAWSFRGGPDHQKLSGFALDEQARSRLGFPVEGVAWSLPIVGPSRTGQVRIEFRADLPWKQRGAIPLISAPRQLSPKTTILIETPSRTRSRVETVGLRRIDTATADRLGASWRGEEGPATAGSGTTSPDDLVAHAFFFTEPGVGLSLTTEELVQRPETGLIRDACLTSLLHPRGPRLNRLRLLLHAEKIGELRFTLPSSASLIRVQLDGADTAPAREEGRLVVTLPAGSPAQRFKTVNIDFEASGAELRTGDLLQPVLPELDIPCFSFCWELIMPPRWQAREHGPGLRPTDPPTAPAWPFSSLGVPQIRWSAQEAREPAGTAETLRRLDEILSSLAAEELTFAECFTRWDSGAYPLIIDRLSLSGAGYGPRSRCVPVGADPRGQALCQRTLQQYGLALIPIDSVLLITSLGEAARYDPAGRWLPALSEVMLWGSDRSDRFQSVSRWRGELTAANAPASGLADPLRTPPGWVISRFTGTSWPGKATRVEIRDERSGLVPGWALALVLLAALSYRPMSTRWGVSLPISLLALSVLIHLWVPGGLANLSAGVFLGAMVSLLHRLGGHLAAWPRREQPRPAPPTSSRGRLARSLFRAAPGVLAIFLISHDRAQACARRSSRSLSCSLTRGPTSQGSPLNKCSFARVITSYSRGWRGPRPPPKPLC